MKITKSSTTGKRRSILQTGKLLLITGLSLMLTISAFADDPGDPGLDPDTTTVPFDGGITLLAAAGVAYGVKRWRDSRKDNDAKEPGSEV